MNGGKIRNSFTVFLAIILAGVFLWFGSLFPSEMIFTSPFSPVKSGSQISIIVVGDIMLDRNVRNRINSLGFDTFFEGVKELISEADIAVGNLEGPFTDYPSVTASLKSKELVFTFDPSLAPKMSDIGFDVLGLANNHTLNFGRKGLDMTRQYISQAGMFYYGEPNNKEELSLVIEKRGIKIGFVGFHEFSYMNFDLVIAEIERIRPDVDVLIVSPHWGIEYQSAPTENMKKWAHEFIDRGADAVIGSHPHIVGDIEEYEGKKIYYSLGNFVFDQYFSEKTMNGLAVRINIEKGEDDKVSMLYDLITVRVDRDGVSEY